MAKKIKSKDIAFNNIIIPDKKLKIILDPIKTNLNWTKLDNGNLQFTWKDSADISPKYVSLQIVQNTELDFHESTRIVMNYTAHRE